MDPLFVSPPESWCSIQRYARRPKHRTVVALQVVGSNNGICQINADRWQIINGKEEEATAETLTRQTKVSILNKRVSPLEMLGWQQRGHDSLWTLLS